jgi:arylsulfatase
MATCLEVSGATYPEREGLQPLQGLSLVPLFSGEGRTPHGELYFRFGSCRALRKGAWKVVSFYGQPWELYHLGSDRFEQNDLAGQHPELVRELSARWHEMAENTDLLAEKDRMPVREVSAPHTHREWHRPQLTEGWMSPLD